jgi:hypothetical protein
MNVNARINSNTSSGHLQKQVDDANKVYIREMLGKVRKSDCCVVSVPASNRGAAASSSVLATRTSPACYNYTAPASGAQASSHLQQKLDAYRNQMAESDRYASVMQRRGAPPCPPEPILYNAGEPIPVPKFPCNLLNNMLFA